MNWPDFACDWTLARSLSFVGIGVHSGAPASLMLHPCERPGLWLRQDQQLLPIDVAAVRDTRYCTTIGPVMTLEHVLAALHGLGLSAIEIETEDGEAPILDGSAAPFVRAIRAVGIVALPSRRRIWRLREPWQWQRGEVSIVAEPADGLEINYLVDFKRTQTHLQQAYHFVWSPQAFIQQIAPARTFSFEADVAGMQALGLVRGGSLANALVLDECGGSLNSLRFDDEPVRHKILDCLGDLALLGGWLKARIAIQRGGHSAHVTMVKTLKGRALLADE